MIGNIIVHQEVDGFDQIRIWYEFTGGNIFHLPYYALEHEGIKVEAVKPFTFINVSGVRLVVVRDEWHALQFEVMRANDIMAYIVLATNPVIEFFKRINHRLILTLCVWNLGKIQWGAVPEWNWIHFIRRVNEWRRNRNSN